MCNVETVEVADQDENFTWCINQRNRKVCFLLGAINLNRIGISEYAVLPKLR